MRFRKIEFAHARRCARQKSQIDIAGLERLDDFSAALEQHGFEQHAKALRESDQAVKRDAEARAYAATPYYAPYPYPYYGGYSVYYGSGWRHRGGWGVSYGAPVWGYPYYW